jgi:hypothetical protein
MFSFFVAIAGLILSSITYSIYQIMDSKEQLTELARSVNRLDPQVEQARYEKEKLYGLATDILRLAPTDTNAAQIVAQYKIRQTPSAQTFMETNAADENPSKP